MKELDSDKNENYEDEEKDNNNVLSDNDCVDDISDDSWNNDYLCCLCL